MGANSCLDIFWICLNMLPTNGCKTQAALADPQKEGKQPHILITKETHESYTLRAVSGKTLRLEADITVQRQAKRPKNGTSLDHRPTTGPSAGALRGRRGRRFAQPRRAAASRNGGMSRAQLLRATVFGQSDGVTWWSVYSFSLGFSFGLLFGNKRFF